MGRPIRPFNAWRKDLLEKRQSGGKCGMCGGSGTVTYQEDDRCSHVGYGCVGEWVTEPCSNCRKD